MAIFNFIILNKVGAYMKILKIALIGLVLLALVSCGGGGGGGTSSVDSSSDVNTPVADSHEIDNSEIDNSEVDTPVTYAPDIETPATDTPVVVTPTANSGSYTLLAWNDLGMHCFDGKDFSVFSILPPYNNLNAQLIIKEGTSNKHVTSGVTVTYEALDTGGHVNTSSSDKTNFWDYLVSLFPGATSTPDVGLTGNKTASNTPASMAYNATHDWWEADGIPIVNYDDNGTTNYYPMVRVVAKDNAQNVLATADVVLPVSDEMDCSKCHSSTSVSNAAKPSTGWVNNADTLKDYKLNILKIHDEKNPLSAADLTAVQTAGYADYQLSLYDTAIAGTPILCAACHSSNALGTSGITGTDSLTSSIHAAHAQVTDPTSGLVLNDFTNRAACYSCHPGASTECLRGAMGKARDSGNDQLMQCQSCHGDMTDVGSDTRSGWLDEPSCQLCHQNGVRYTTALVSGVPRTVTDSRFATEANTPASGKSLYRFSTGHGDLQCSSCHGSTHAIFPTSHEQDNIISTQIQGHSGTIAECTACHTETPSTTTGGPHGMHSVGQYWVSAHQNAAEHNRTQCTACHGADYRGSVLSKTFSARSFGIKTYSAGAEVSCYDCHNGPDI